MRFPKHVFLIHGNHESSLFTYEQTKTIDKNTTQTFFWNDFFHEKFPIQKHKEHPFTRLLDLFKAMPSAVLCTLRHTSIQTETPIIETRRILCLHGGLSSIIPIPNLHQIINHHPPIMDDIYAPSGLSTRQLEQWSRRTQHYSFNYAASVADPYAADEPWKGRSRFSPITTRAFMAANRIDLILRGHQCPMNAEGSAESHDGSIITTFGAFDYFGGTTPPYFGEIPEMLLESEETFTSVIFFIIKTIHLDSLAKLVRSAA
ncbi:hypothetical protein BLNAU_22457 [Blattamonas nauphoetae]|uniref:protein-serine/threonine phosphatase n=1 Tax=Blattamonas nauphoetae TaxID=2049346 RepID=A0ABQ9WU44_9EUKA|nr:hypothetical protein BLNAU_22457 [Blattamonas nauphoetae]